MRAILLTAGREAAEAILAEAGLMQLVQTATIKPVEAPPIATRAPTYAAAAQAWADAAAASDVRTLAMSGLASGGEEPVSAEEQAFEELLLKVLADSGVRATPEPALSELCAEALNMLGVSLDMQNMPRASQILLSHAMVVRRRLLGRSHHEVAATYNNLANLLRKPGLNGKRGAPVSERNREVQRLVEALYRRAIAIRETTLGPQSPQLAATLSNLSVYLSVSHGAADRQQPHAHLKQWRRRPPPQHWRRWASNLSRRSKAEVIWTPRGTVG